MIALFCLISFFHVEGQVNKIYFIPTLHGLHQSNTRYSYDSLKKIIADLKPDIIGVEIRPEDINADSAYLRKNYPFEMRMMRYWFPDTNVQGFDWLGRDIEGKPIPANYWTEISSIKRYERELAADSIFLNRVAVCDSFSAQRLQLLKNFSLYEILDSDDAILTREYYKCLATQLKGSHHTRLLKFYDLRNEKILKNIQRIAKKNQNKTIVIITGDDHYVALKQRFNHQLLPRP